MKTAKQLERYCKGVANHRRIAILHFVYENEGATLEEIATALRANTKTLSEHTRRLVQAGLLDKQYQDKYVLHSLSPYGKEFHKFLSTF